ncbi:hypothetical protein NHX12_021528 [Muraenolepis orangiensis]|uniref:Uncharacterized protein n=1 Tax=Muraenolepis orangiensis TaxID=630683 RepID=A0A9Q0ESA6_9TELE|nr:hypothetical protein NHX12_021528 [Muraenolepis orangiensis]
MMHTFDISDFLRDPPALLHPGKNRASLQAEMKTKHLLGKSPTEEDVDGWRCGHVVTNDITSKRTASPLLDKD